MPGDLYDMDGGFWEKLESGAEVMAKHAGQVVADAEGSPPAAPAGAAAIERWQRLSLFGGTGAVALGGGLLLLTKKGRGWGTWLIGMGGGLLTAGFAFPIKALPET